MCPTTSGSISVQWLGAAMKPPAGSFSRPSHFFPMRRFITGRMIPATVTNVTWLLADSFTGPPLLGRGDVEIGAEARELLGKALVAAVDDVDTRDAGGAGGGQGGNEVAESAAQVRDVDVGALELRRTGDDGGVQEVALAEAARHAAEALAVDLDIGAHADQCIGEAEPVLVHGLVDNRNALGLGQGDDERLLPVRHESGVHVCFEDQGVELAAAVVEADAVVADVHAAADLAVRVQEGHHVALGGAFDKDVAAGDQGRGSPGGGLVAVREGAVIVAAEVTDALDS